MKRLPVLFIGILVLTANSALSVYSETVGKWVPSTVGLGHIEFPTSGAPEAQSWFLRGVLLLHNFQYDDAEEAFRQAQLIDSTFAMAYWGEAMTVNHPLWNEQNLQEGRAILHRLASNPDSRLTKAPTKREQRYLRAINALYGDGDKQARDHAYVNAMRQLTEDFPDDLEASAFYALAILGSAQGERDTTTYMKAAAIAEEVYRKKPQTPRCCSLFDSFLR